jgi:hypothetical protein
MLLILSIGLVSVNSPLSSVNAQNTALSQHNVGEAEQDIEQSQSSNQDGQVVSGDNNVLSGNNLICQNQGNTELLNQVCNSGLGLGNGDATIALNLIVFAERGTGDPDREVKITTHDNRGQLVDDISYQTYYENPFIRYLELSGDSKVFEITITNIPDDGSVEYRAFNSPPLDCQVNHTEHIATCTGDAVDPLDYEIRISKNPHELRQLIIKTVLRANCNPVFPPCPSPDGVVQLYVAGSLYSQYEANSQVSEGTTQRTFELPVGIPYRIHAVAGHGGVFEYEFGNIQGDCSGRDTCNSTMGPNGANVIVNFHYCLIRC